MKPKIGITIGDINGIGLEVIIKTLSNDYITSKCTPIIYGSSKVIGYHKNIVDQSSFSTAGCSGAERAQEGKVNVINCWQDEVNVTIGKATKESGECAYIALDRAVNDLLENQIDALVTAPINKHAMKMANFPHLGHTEYIAERAGADDCLMLLISEALKVAVVTTHVPLSDVAELITKKKVLKKIKLLNKSLKEDFGLERPVIAVLGLNPHASDESEIGHEEKDSILPAITEAKRNGIIASGPYPADGFFGGSSYKKFDAVLAMYHDQGLIPFKSMSFGDGVNFTAGLSVVRTSPDHGTAYEIAGQNLADPSSFRKALFRAIDIAEQRKIYKEITIDKVKKVELREERMA